MKSFIILDRSGSMISRWAETLVALDTYFAGLPAGTKTSLLAFDQEMDWVFDNETPPGLKAKMQELGIGPRGMTALFDAIGTMADHVEKHAKKKAQIVILTDGAENASHRTRKDRVADIVKGWQERGFDVVFLGADFDAFREAATVGVSAHQTMNYRSANADVVGQTMADRATAYAQTGEVRAFNDEEREAALK